MKKTIATICMALLMFSAYAGGKTPKWMNGHWTGTGYQVDGTTWEVVLEVTDNGMAITYPDVGEGCKGVWVPVKKKRGVYEFQEKISSGPCDDNVQVLVTRLHSCAMSVAYFLPGIISGVAAHTVLEK